MWRWLGLLLVLGTPGLVLRGPVRPARAAAAGTLDQLVADLDARLERALASRPGSLARTDLALALQAGAGVSGRLRQVVLRLLESKLSAKGLRSFSRLEAGSRSALERRARAQGYELLLSLELLMVEGQLHLQGDLVATDRLLWRDIRQPERGALSHLHASVRVDAEVRAFQGSLSSPRTRFSHQSHPHGRLEALALGAGDLDGDGRAELVLLTARAVEVLRYRSTGFSPLVQLKLSGAAAPLRPRRTLGSLLVRDLDRDRRAEVLVRSSELEKGAELAYDGKALIVRRELEGYPLSFEEIGNAATVLLAAGLPGQDLFGGATLSRSPAGPAAEWQQALPPSFYTLRAVRVPGPRARTFVAVLDGAGQLSLFASDGRTPLVSLARVGVALDLCDLDDDGRLDLISTGGEGPESEDQITVHELLQPSGAPAELRPVWRSPGLGGQVTALAHGDLDGSGKLKVVAAVRQKSQLVLMVIQ